ncbi:MAG: tetratricopeptide repeat protein [Deltaproteobacteria bacterium]|nr:tetratricopeptide repeat protein [Deltaproteobacteria bacterium]
MRILLVAAFFSLTAQAAAGTIQDANKAYSTGNFDAAARGYEEQVARGVVHEDLYYNLGNAYFRLGRLGPAIYNYERALLLAPGMPDATYNLEVARSAVAEKVRDRMAGAEQEPRWMRMVNAFTISELTMWLLVTNLLLFALLVALRFLDTGFRRSVLMVLTAFVAVALLAFASLFGGNIYARERVQTGVVLPDQIAMREGQGEQTAERGLLHAGVRVRVLETRGKWMRIRLSNGVEGWIVRDQVGVL